MHTGRTLTFIHGLLGSGLAAMLLSGCEPGGDTGPVAPDPPVPTTIIVTPASATLTALGEELDLAARVRDQHGAAMPAVTVTWRSADEGVLSVRTTGGQTARAIAAAPGEAGVTATAGSISATADVRVEQTPASMEGVTDTHLEDISPGTAVALSARVRDRNGHPVAGVPAVFSIEEGGGTVNPASSTADAEGLVATTWTVGASGNQALAVAAGPASVRFTASLCTPLVIGSDLRIGEPTVVERAAHRCGVTVEAPEAGAYYRFTLVGTSVARGPADSVALSLEASGARQVFAAASNPSPGPGPPIDPHPGRREGDRRILRWIARSDGPDPLPDLRGVPQRAQAEPPEIRVFTRGSAGTLEDNCTVSQRVTAVRLAYNDHIAIYADETLSPRLPADSAGMLADYYGDFGAPVIRQYFGGVGDVDGDGRILALIQDLGARVIALVWMGELLSKDDCPASNQAELMRIDHSRAAPGLLFRLAGAVVHEAKHISSHHQLVRRARERGLDHFAVMNPMWVEEGAAEIAREVAARLGWESIGGPPPGATVRGSDLRRPNGTAGDMWTPAAHGVSAVLERYGRVLVSQPHSVTGHDPYGAGWGFLRFLGDWHGGAGSSRLGDAAMFARLNDATAPEGLDGILEVTGLSFEELMVAYAHAVSLAGTGSPEVPGVPRFSTYDMTGMNRTPFSTLLGTGRFPYPVTITGQGGNAPLWLPLGESATIAGWIGPNGFRIHDFRAERAGDRATATVDAPEHVRLVVTRIPDQSGK